MFLLPSKTNLNHIGTKLVNCIPLTITSLHKDNDIAYLEKYFLYFL